MVCKMIITFDGRLLRKRFFSSATADSAMRRAFFMADGLEWPENPNHKL